MVSYSQTIFGMTELHTSPIYFPAAAFPTLLILGGIAWLLHDRSRLNQDPEPFSQPTQAARSIDWKSILPMHRERILKPVVRRKQGIYQTQGGRATSPQSRFVHSYVASPRNTDLEENVVQKRW